MARPTACPCGSGLYPSAHHDARMIFLFYACNRCEARKVAGIRPEVMTDPNYDHTEDIEDD
jgi:hypothetical protein